MRATTKALHPLPGAPDVHRWCLHARLAAWKNGLRQRLGAGSSIRHVSGVAPAFSEAHLVAQKALEARTSAGVHMMQA